MTYFFELCIFQPFDLLRLKLLCVCAQDYRHWVDALVVCVCVYVFCCFFLKLLFESLSFLKLPTNHFCVHLKLTQAVWMDLYSHAC